MNKKGFTLVELLAVIAILAILVIIALPNVLSMFNSAKKDIFLTESKNIYKEISKKYITENMKGNKLNYISSEDNTKLDLESSNLKYCIKMDDFGNVTSIKIGDGEYYIEYEGNKKLSDFSSDDIVSGKLDDYSCGSSTKPNEPDKNVTLTSDNFIISVSYNYITLEFTSDSDLSKVNKVKYKIYITADYPDDYKTEKLYKEVELTDKSNLFKLSVSNPVNAEIFQVTKYRIEVLFNDKGKSFEKTYERAFCFVAGTKVKTEKGFKNIEDIKIGENVYSYNLDNNELELKKVTNTIESSTIDTYKMTIGDKTVEMSPRHQIYIIDKGWVRAYDVKKGDMMLSINNEKIEIKDVKYIKYDKPIKTYNLTIEGNSNYFVTDIQVLVHNAVSID